MYQSVLDGVKVNSAFVPYTSFSIIIVFGNFIIVSCLNN